jgi:hypothetical protein
MNIEKIAIDQMSCGYRTVTDIQLIFYPRIWYLIMPNVKTNSHITLESASKIVRYCVASMIVQHFLCLSWVKVLY